MIFFLSFFFFFFFLGGGGGGGGGWKNHAIWNYAAKLFSSNARFRISVKPPGLGEIRFKNKYHQLWMQSM